MISQRLARSCVRAFLKRREVIHEMQRRVARPAVPRVAALITIAMWDGALKNYGSDYGSRGSPSPCPSPSLRERELLGY
jgi:hypothetical protein